MIINSVIRLIISLSIVLIFPFIQKQWLNLYLFNLNNFTFYSFLYYLSGIVCPVIVFLNSLSYFTYYEFNNKQIHNVKLIKGKLLLFLISITLIPLSFLLSQYLFISLDLAFNFFFGRSNIQAIDSFNQIYIVIILSLLLIFKKTRYLVKKFSLINFIFVSSIVWYSQINNILISEFYLINRYFNINNLNFTNVIYLFSIELLYYFWSVLSNKNNLTDWIVPINLRNDTLFIWKILIFYGFLVFYYTILM